MTSPAGRAQDASLFDQGLAVEAMTCPTASLSIAYVIGYFGHDDAVRMLDAAGLSQKKRLPKWVSKIAFWHMCIQHMRASNDEGSGSTKQAIPRWTWSTVFAAVNQTSTLGDGLKKLAELAPIVPAGIRVTLSHSARGVHVNFRMQESGVDLQRRERYLETIAVGFHCMLLWVSAEVIMPVEVRLSGNLEDCEGSLLSGFSPIQSRHGNGLTVVYSRHDLGTPLGVRKYNAWCTHETTTFLELVATLPECRAGALSETAEAVKQMLQIKPLSQIEVAHMLGLSVPTLRRRLATSGSSFRGLSKEARLGKLLTLLASNEGLDDIASELGLSERRSLWRICHDWLGISPSVYRKNCGV